jgi:hypothetical protein
VAGHRRSDFVARSRSYVRKASSHVATPVYRNIHAEIGGEAYDSKAEPYDALLAHRRVGVEFFKDECVRSKLAEDPLDAPEAILVLVYPAVRCVRYAPIMRREWAFKYDPAEAA